MTYQTGLNAALVFHLTGLAMLVGSTLLDFIITTRFWKIYATNKSEALVVRQVSDVFPIVTRLGGALMILSGIAMMAITHGVYGSQLWMRIKISLVVLIILNVSLVGRRNGKRLFQLLNEEREGLSRTNELEKVKGTTRLFYLSQLLLFVIIFVLSAFKFN